MAYDQIVESGPPILTPGASNSMGVYNSDIVNWPWPRIVPTKYRTLGFFKQLNSHIYLFEMTLTNYGRWEMYVVGDLGDADVIAQLDVADFGPFYIVSTLGYDNNFGRVVQTFLRDTTLIQGIANRDQYGINFINSFQVPAFATCTNFNGQLLGGNIYSPGEGADNYWLELDTNHIVWSAIGAFELSPLVDKTAGFREMLGNTSSGRHAVVYKMLPLHEGVVVYTDCGNYILVDHGVNGVFTYGLVPLKGLGIDSGNHVAGGDYVHGVIDLNKDFWVLENSSPRTLSQDGGKWTKLGYREHIVALFDEASPVIMSYLPRDRRFYISNGTTSLVINQFGACTIHQSINGILQGHDGVLYGTFIDSMDMEGRITLDTTDFNSRGLKTLESLVYGVRVEPGVKVIASTDRRITKSAAYTRGGYRASGPRGETVLHVTAEEFRPTIKFSSYLGSEMEYWNANVKFPDARFRRGLSIQSQGTQQQPG